MFPIVVHPASHLTSVTLPEVSLHSSYRIATVDRLFFKTTFIERSHFKIKKPVHYLTTVIQVYMNIYMGLVSTYGSKYLCSQTSNN